MTPGSPTRPLVDAAAPGAAQAAGAAAARSADAADSAGGAIFGSADLQSGFKPVQAFAAGGGDIAAFRVEDKKLACAGFVSAVPSYSFTWTGQAAGSPAVLRGAEG